MIQKQKHIVRGLGFVTCEKFLIENTFSFNEANKFLDSIWFNQKRKKNEDQEKVERKK